MKLQKYCFGELLSEKGYLGKQCRVVFESGNKDGENDLKNKDVIKLFFPDNSHLFVSYDRGSLFRVEVSKNRKVSRRLIPNGRPTHDEHYCDALSMGFGEDCVMSGEEFNIWERFSFNSLEKILSKVSKKFVLKSVEPSFGLQHWLKIGFYKKSRFFPSDISIGFRFSKNSIPEAIYSGNGESIIYRV